MIEEVTWIGETTPLLPIVTGSAAARPAAAGQVVGAARYPGFAKAVAESR